MLDVHMQRLSGAAAIVLTHAPAPLSLLAHSKQAAAIIFCLLALCSDLVVIQCGHIFHGKCVKQWIEVLTNSISTRASSSTNFYAFKSIDSTIFLFADSSLLSILSQGHSLRYPGSSHLHFKAPLYDNIDQIFNCY